MSREEPEDKALVMAAGLPEVLQRQCRLALADSSSWNTEAYVTLGDLLRYLAGREASALDVERLEDHVPSGGEGMDGYGYVSCSCGWGDWEKPTWVEHLRAALAALADTPTPLDVAAEREYVRNYITGRDAALREALVARFGDMVGRQAAADAVAAAFRAALDTMAARDLTEGVSSRQHG